MSRLYLIISAGSGPRECHWAAQKIAAVFAREAKAESLSSALMFGNDKGGSFMLMISGETADVFARRRLGTIRWIGQSPFRKNHKRKNWYVSVSLAPSIKDVPDLREADIRYQTLKASGPGGQHMNATESAVRAVHIPTGISAVAREERSQHANKKLCRAKLAAHFLELKSQAGASAKTTEWKDHKSLERGNEVRVYRGAKFKLETS